VATSNADNGQNASLLKVSEEPVDMKVEVVPNTEAHGKTARNTDSDISELAKMFMKEVSRTAKSMDVQKTPGQMVITLKEHSQMDTWDHTDHFTGLPKASHIEVNGKMVKDMVSVKKPGRQLMQMVYP